MRKAYTIAAAAGGAVLATVGIVMGRLVRGKCSLENDVERHRRVESGLHALVRDKDRQIADSAANHKKMLQNVLDSVEAGLGDDGVSDKMACSIVDSGLFTFEHIMLFDDRNVQTLLRMKPDIDVRILAKALIHAEDSIVKRFLSNVSKRYAAMLKEEMEWQPTVRPKDSAEAQRLIAVEAVKLVVSGKIYYHN